MGIVRPSDLAVLRLIASSNFAACTTGRSAGFALGLMRTEIERGMRLMGCTTVGQFSRENLRFR